MSIATQSLGAVVAHARASLAAGLAALPVLRPRRDPLSIDLPPVVGGDLTPAALAHLGALYLFSQLDQGGVIVAVEALVEARNDLSLRDTRSAEELDKLAIDAHSFPNRTEREAIYARLFGAGGQASLASSANHDFPSQMAAVCSAIVQLAEQMRTSPKSPSPGMFAPLQVAMQQLIEGLALHSGADVVRRAQRVHDLLVRSLGILQLDGVTSYFGVHGAADVVHAILGNEAPNLGSAQRRGLAGQQLIAACGRAMGRSGAPSAIVSGATDPIVAVAAQWLAESGAAGAS